MKTFTDILNERNTDTRNIVIEIVDDDLPKQITLEYLRIDNKDYSLSYELSHTKRNLIEIDEQICRPKRIEKFSKSGKCQLWFSYPKGKSFSQYSFPTDCKIINVDNF